MIRLPNISASMNNNNDNSNGKDGYASPTAYLSTTNSFSPTK